MAPTAPSISDPAKPILPFQSPTHVMSRIQEPQKLVLHQKLFQVTGNPFSVGVSHQTPCTCLPANQSPWTKNALPERVGKGYVNVEVTLWLVCTVHTEAQSSRVPTACCKCKDCKKLSKTNNILILFRCSTHTTSRSVQQQHQSPRVRLSITPRTQSTPIHYSCTLPKRQYREPEDLKPCCFTWTEPSPFVCVKHLSPPPLSQSPLGIHSAGSYLNHPTDGQAQAGREGWILTEHNEAVFAQIKHWQKYL